MKIIAFNPPSSNTQLNKIKETIGFKSWLEQNTQIDESFKFCVLKEQVLKCYICEQNNIPYFIDKIPENFISIFDVPQTGIDVMWNDLMKDDIKREIKCESLESRILRAFETLTQREVEVLILRFGLFGHESQTFKEIGLNAHNVDSGKIGITQERIRQIEAKAIRKLRHPARRHFFE